MTKINTSRQPSLVVSFVPLAVLIIFLALSIKLFGGDAIAGASQLSLLSAFGSGGTEDKGREDVRHGNKNHDHSQHDYNRNSEY